MPLKAIVVILAGDWTPGWLFLKSIAKSVTSSC